MSGENIYEEFGHYFTPPSWESKAMEPLEFHAYHQKTVKDKDSRIAYWSEWANKLSWFKKWDQVLDDSNPPFYRWFVGGETNLSHLCLDWQIAQGRKNKIALIWEGEPFDETMRRPEDIKKYTYYDLYRRVNRTAFALKEKLGVQKGEIITLYMPMVPELLIYMLAIQRLGASHSVIYSGFSALAIADRAVAAGSRYIITADALYRRGNILPLKEIVDEATEICEERGHRIKNVVVLKRTNREAVPWKLRKDIWHHELIRNITENVYVEPVRQGADDFSYVLYTSGTTGAPKGIQHSISGYATGLYATMKLVFDIKENDIFWCAADVGWVTGHSYIVYGPLMTGATTVMYEGAPIFPRPDRWWHMIERYGVTIFYTAPTAIRMLMKYPLENVTRHDLSTLRIMHSVGEPINPEAFRWYYHNIGKDNIVASSTWWMTETGHIVTGHTPGLDKIYPLKAGTNGFPLPGIDVEVLDENGIPSKPGERGYYCITTPWPGMAMTLYNDPEKFIEVYWGKYSKEKDNKWLFYTGDFAVKDKDGYVWVLGRADDVLKVAGHRIGTAEVESAMISHTSVAESACTGKPDQLKGEIPVVFTVLKHGFIATPELRKELKAHLRKTMGAVVASDVDILIVESVPKTRSGKIMRRLLKAVVSGETLGDVTTLEDGVAIEDAKKSFDMLKSSMESTV